MEALIIKELILRITTLLQCRYKNKLSPHVSSLLLILILTACLTIHPVRGSNIICSKSEYVTSGIEFKKCQDETLQSFEPQSEAARRSS